MRRRLMLGAMIGAAAPMPSRAQEPLWSLQARMRLLGGDGALGSAEVVRLGEEAEALLAAGQPEAAKARLDRAALMVHSADIEFALVRSDMQAGHYRQAVSFAAHAALAHRSVPGGAALYAWLLHLGGQRVFARRLLDEQLLRAPDDEALRSARAALADDWPVPAPGLLRAPLRLAPYATGALVPERARVAGTGVLGRSGLVACAPTAALEGADRVWVRDGLGRAVAARVERREEPLALLSLSQPLPAVDVQFARRAPFAGSPATTVEFAPGDASAGWPIARAGFLGRAGLLGIDTPPGARGGPVFDAEGRLAGIALRQPDGSETLETVDRWPAELGGGFATHQTARLSLDETYEVALRVAVQLLVPGSGV